jgi:uncharacterized membrane protein
MLARVVAASFLFLSGMSLVLGHCERFRPGAFFRRLLTIAGAALLVSVATYIAVPAHYVYFGILHAIAIASVICLPFVWLPPWASSAAAGAILVVSVTWGRSALDAPWAAFTGLSSVVRPSLDFLPLFPWLAPCLLGVALATSVELRWRSGRSRLRASWAGPIGWPGRHSLAIYLVHQPILLAAIWLALQLGASALSRALAV